VPEEHYVPEEQITQFNSNTSIDASTYSALTDRKISEATARQYGVKVITSRDGTIFQHKYPYYD
jgi:hypothetical protein